MILLGVVCVLLGVVMYLTRPSRLNHVLVDLLESSIGCDATVGRSHLTWGGVLTVDDIELTVPGADPETSRLLSTERMTVKLKLLPLIIGQVRAESVALHKPTLYLTEDADNGRFNYEMLLARPTEPTEASLPDALPELHLYGGQLCFGEVVNGAYDPIESIELNGRLNADGTRAGVYQFELTQRQARDKSQGPSIRGLIDLKTPGVELTVKRFSFDGPYRYLLPRYARDWWDHLDPSGAVPRVSIHARRGEKGKASVHAEMVLDGIGLQLPWVKTHPLAVTKVSGMVDLTQTGMRFDHVTGSVEGISLSADGRIDGYDRDAPWQLHVRSEPFDVPAEGGIWEKLPESVSVYRERFSPRGVYRADVSVSREAPDQAFQVNGYVDLIDTKFMYYRFQYPVAKLTGRIGLEGDRIVLNDLIGITPAGAKGTVSGSIGPPLKDGPVDLKISSDRIPLDENLTNAMSEKRRKVLDMFFSEAGYQSLLKQGVVRAPGDQAEQTRGGEAPVAQANNGASIAPAAPEFKPGGTAAMTVTIQRPAGEDQEYQVTTDLQTAGLASVFSFWHYPLIAQGGRIVITPDNVDVIDVRMRSPNGGGGVVNGHLDLPHDGSHLKPDLKLTDINLPVDDLLIASIPEPKDQWVRSLNITGKLQGNGEVDADDSGEVRFTVKTQLQQARAQPFGGQYVLNDVSGDITLQRSSVQMDDLTGKHDGGTITLNGRADFPESGADLDLHFAGDNLPIEHSLVDLIPPDHEARPLIEKLFETYKPEGVTDARMTYKTNNGSGEDFSLDIQPDTLGFDYKKQRIELSDLQGTISLSPSKAVLHHVSGRYPAGDFSVDGEARYGEDNGLALRFSAKADGIDATARALMPQACRSLIDRLALRGPFVLEDATLSTRPNATEGPNAIFEAGVGLQNAEAKLGVDLTEIDADLNMRIVAFGNQPWPHTDIKADIQHLRAADRLVQRASMHVQTGSEPSVIDFQDLKGTVYGGTLVGRGQARLDPPGVLGFELTILESELEPFLDPLGNKAPAKLKQAASPVPGPDLPMRDMSSGLLSAGLAVRLSIDGTQPTQGRGIVMVRDARLYDKPLTLALLQAVNLSLPNERSFDRASARYVIDGDNILFDDIRFEAPAFVIAGTGTMAYPSTDLNLHMVTSNPVAPDLGPVSELVKTFKDQLFAIEVKGTLAQPKAGVVPLEGVFRSWGRIFGETRANPINTPVEQPEEEDE